MNLYSSMSFICKYLNVTTCMDMLLYAKQIDICPFMLCLSVLVSEFVLISECVQFWFKHECIQTREGLGLLWMSCW